jgi:hypothetical protein
MSVSGDSRIAARLMVELQKSRPGFLQSFDPFNLAEAHD